MKYLLSFLASVIVLTHALSAYAENEVRCDSLFSNMIADVTVFATHLSPHSNRPWSPFRFHFYDSMFTIQVLGNFAESPEARAKFPEAVFSSSKPRNVSVNAENRLVAVLGGDSSVYAFADGLEPQNHEWRRIDQARGKTATGFVFLVYEVPLTSTRPNYGYFKIYATDGAKLRELGTVVPHVQKTPGEPMRIQYPSKIYGVYLISDTRVELASEDGSVIIYEIEPPTPQTEQGLKLRGFAP